MNYINYCINLTNEEKLKIDKQVRKNRFKLKFAIFFPIPFFPSIPVPQVPFTPVEGFSPQQIIRNGRDRAESAAKERLEAAEDRCIEFIELANECKETIKSAKELAKEWQKLSAEEKYEDIRNSKTDVDAIAKNTGYKPENIQKCKNHIFYDTHKLDRYESLGEPVETKRFDANENQARAWRRLEEGTHTKEDLTWLKHEKAEQWYEQKYDAGYSESHEKAERQWSGAPWTKDKD